MQWPEHECSDSKRVHENARHQYYPARCILFDTFLGCLNVSNLIHFAEKKVIWQGDSLKTLKRFPDPVKYEFGVELMRVQAGQDPTDWKPMTSVGPGVKEIRVQFRDQYRFLYVASLGDAVYVLNAFVKKTQRTPKSEIDKARTRFRDIQQSRKS